MLARNNWCFLFVLFAASIASKAQSDSVKTTLELPIKEQKNFVFLVAENRFNASALTNKMAFATISGTQLSADDISRSSNKSLKENYANYNYKNGISFTMLDSAKGKTLIFGLYHVEHMDASYKKDAFDFVFKGNKIFAGKTANLGSLNYRNFSYNELVFGNHKVKNKNGHRIMEYGTVSILIPSSVQNLRLAKADIFTEENGEFIDATYSYQSNGIKGNTSFSFSGIGISLNGAFSNRKDQWEWGAEAKDYGLMFFGKKAEYGIKDSSLRWEGIQINSFNNITLQPQIDSFNQIFQANNSTKSFALPLQSSLEVFIIKHLKNNTEWFSGFRSIFVNARPQVYTGIRKSFQGNQKCFATLSFGGVGGIDLDAGYLKYFQKGYLLSINLYSIEGAAAPALNSGIGFGVRLGKSIN